MTGRLRDYPMRRTQRRVSIPELVKAMTEAGATFRHSECGTWLVDDLASLPCNLRDDFFACDERELAAELRRIEARQIQAA